MHGRAAAESIRRLARHLEGRTMTYVPHTERERARCSRRSASRAWRTCSPTSRQPVRFPELEAAAAGLRARDRTARCRRSRRAISCVDPALSFLGAGDLSPLPAGDRRLRAAPRRILHLLHAVPAGGEPGHAAGAVRIPEHDLPAHRHGGEQRQPLRRRHRARRGGAARAQRRRRASAARSSCRRPFIRNTARW